MTRGKCRRSGCSNLTRSSGGKAFCDKHRKAMGPTGYVDPAPAIEHLNLLHERGMSWDAISEVLGMSRRGTQLVRLGKSTRMQAKTVQRILDIPVPEKFVDEGMCPVNPIGARRRIGALMALGHSHRDISKAAGIHQNQLWRVFRNDSIRSSTARAISDVFGWMQFETGGSIRSKRWAQEHGYPTPFSWEENEIDDPRARPRIDPTLLTKGRLEEYKRLRDEGLTKKEIAKRFGLNESTLYDWINRQKKKGNL
ncbi:helix-turn-helix DNA binding protein [Mycobacterium phage KashFlow]|nr:helix-turn-helix DNA binding protein [Mycobacterium phage Squint]QPO16732.1 helix-turn-helix DNA binding protein [Mycobacterium phage KashFlow]